MELQLKNIGMIKEANVKIDGLTVIAGENDTGKSTVGKALFFQLKSIFLAKRTSYPLQNTLLSTLFHNQISDDGIINLKMKNFVYKTIINNNLATINFDKKSTLKYIPIMIETPLIWNFSNLFNQIPILESQIKVLGDEINIDYPFLLKDLHFYLTLTSEQEAFSFDKKIASIIDGRFEHDKFYNFYFLKNNKKIKVINTATGIKYFGIFQVLSQNSWLNENTVLILDEPEVHLHPKWQLEMAKIIVELVKNGVKIVVNSHSPYMIEALERYAEKAEVPADFYLAEDGIIDKVEDNNSKTLAKIFNKLSAPYETFNQMDSETLKGG